MAFLKTSDFSKNSSNGLYAGKSRHEIFELKIKDGRDFFLTSGGTGTAVKGVGYAKTGSTGGDFTYQDRTGKLVTIKATKVFKDPDFGGGSGSGGGAQDTKYTESLQCFYCSHVFNFARKPVKTVSTADLEKAATYAETDATLADCLAKGPKDWIETDVYIKTANKVWELYGRKTAGRKTYFHRGSTFMNNLYKAKAAVHKLDKTSDDQQAPGSFSNDKWNPGDIWMSTLDPFAKPLSEFDAWGPLNIEVLKLADEGTLLGISLKKIGPMSPARSQEYNRGQATVKPVTFTSASFGSTGDFFSSIDGYIQTSANRIQFRAFDGTKGWQGEIKDKVAAGGKIGGGNVDFYMQKFLKKDLYPGTSGEPSVMDIVRTPQLFEDMYAMYREVNPHTSPMKQLLTSEEFYEKLTEKNDSFKFSKYLVLRLYKALFEGTSQQRNAIINEFFRYASSNTDQSSFFIKVY